LKQGAHRLIAVFNKHKNVINVEGDEMKYAIVIVDMINEFIDGILKIGRAKELIPKIKSIITYARAHNIPVIYVSDSHLPEDTEFKVWGPHAITGSIGSQVIDELKPQPNDIVLCKTKYSAFFGTSLDNVLRELGISTLIVTGVATNICIQHTVADAFFRGYDVIVPQDCVDAFTDVDQKAGLDYMKKIYGSKIVTFDEVLKILGEK